MLTGPAVNQSAGPPPEAMQLVFDYSGSNLIYTGYAFSDQANAVAITVSAASNASPVSFTATAHGFDFNAVTTVLPVVMISGGTGNWAAINGVWMATPTSANAFTISVDSTAFGALTGTLLVTTRAPLTSNPVWAISKNVYSAGNALIWTGWAANPDGTASTNLVSGVAAMRFKWTSRTTLAYS